MPRYSGDNPFGKFSVIVAANDASQKYKDGADYICDGAADDVQIQAAIDSLPTNGGTIILSEGTFTIAAAITTTKSNVTIRGSGVAGYLSPYGGTILQTSAAIYIFDFGSASATNHRGPKVSDIAFVDTSAGTASGAIRIRRMNHSRFYDCSFHDFTTGYCIHLDGTGDACITTLIYGTKARNNLYGIAASGTVTSTTVYGGFWNGNNLANGIGFRLGNTGYVAGAALDSWATAIRLESEQSSIRGRFESNTTAIHITSDSGRNSIFGCEFINNTANITMDDPNEGTVSTRGNNTVGFNCYTPSSSTAITNSATGNFSNSVFEPVYNTIFWDAVVNGTYTARMRNRRQAGTDHTKFTIETNQGAERLVLGQLFGSYSYVGSEANNDFEIRRNNTAVARATTSGGLDIIGSGQGLIVTTPDGTKRYRIRVDNAGTVTTELVA